MPDQTLEPLPEDWTTGLAIVAHPDDLEYGAASAVAKWTAAGKRITYVLVTSGEAGLAIPPEEAGPLREAEERASAAVVGVDTVEFLGHPDGVVIADLELRRDLARAIRRHRPEVVIGINFRDSWGGPSLNMADHRHVGDRHDRRHPRRREPLGSSASSSTRDTSRGAASSSRASARRRSRPTTSTSPDGWSTASSRSNSIGRTSTTSTPTPARCSPNGPSTTGAKVGCEHAAAFEVIRP